MTIKIAAGEITNNTQMLRIFFNKLKLFTKMFHHFFLYPFPLGLIYTNKNDLIDLRSEKSFQK